MAMGVLKILATKVSYFTILYELTTTNVFFHLNVSGRNSLYQVIRPVQFIFVDRFLISLIVEELCSLNKEMNVMFN